MVKSITEVCRKRLAPRVIGFDDAPFQSRPRAPGTPVSAVGIVTSSDRFEGMLYENGITMDGDNAQSCLQHAITHSKFHAQIHAILVDGITMGGLNVIDIQFLARTTDRPVIAVMRRQPDLPKFLQAVDKVPDSAMRVARLQAAGPVHSVGGWVFQYRCPPNAVGNECSAEVTPEDIAVFLDQCTPKGTQKIPECLRIAHLVGAAIKTGQSSSSA